MAERWRQRSDSTLAVGLAETLGGRLAFDDVFRGPFGDRKCRLRAEDLEHQLLDRSLEEASREHRPRRARERARDFGLLPGTVPRPFPLVGCFFNLCRVLRPERLRLP